MSIYIREYSRTVHRQLASAIEQQQNVTICVCVTIHSSTKVIIIQQDLHWRPANNYHHTSSHTIGLEKWTINVLKHIDHSTLLTTVFVLITCRIFSITMFTAVFRLMGWSTLTLLHNTHVTHRPYSFTPLRSIHKDKS